ncbi:MAG: hypothetical protein IPM98_20620 [Lewinellaceae bacterium]|nr:hypothetical protein [Lewinellaceae bacterium]
MKPIRNFLKSALTLLVLTTLSLSAAFAGPDSLGAVFDSLGVVSYTDPTSFVTPSATDSVEVAITILLGLFAGAVPGLKRIPKTFIRSAAAALLVAGGAATFKLGFLTQESFEYVIQQFLPNFAYAGLIYNVLKFGLPAIGKMLGKDWNFFQSIKP